MTHRLSANASDIEKASRILQDGGLVAFPTETVYGLGADACNPSAVERIFEVKGRPSSNPLIVHVQTLEAAHELAEFNAEAEALARAFWPGPLTLVLPIRSESAIAPPVTAGLETVALRVPDAPISEALLARFGGPIAAPSANRSGRLSPTCETHVLSDLDGAIEAVIEGGRAPLGIESTIVASAPLRILRYGALISEQIEAVTGVSPRPVPSVCDKIEAPGQLSTHYAPRAALRINAKAPMEDEVYISFGEGRGNCEGLNLSLNGSLEEASANLFDCLRKADALALGKMGKIAITPIPAQGIGLAINDRLNRAATPKS